MSTQMCFESPRDCEYHSLLAAAARPVCHALCCAPQIAAADGALVHAGDLMMEAESSATVAQRSENSAKLGECAFLCCVNAQLHLVGVAAAEDWTMDADEVIMTLLPYLPTQSFVLHPIISHSTATSTLLQGGSRLNRLPPVSSPCSIAKGE